MSDLPPRDATERFLAQLGRWGRGIDIAFDVDLGELVDGHRVVARGLELRGSGAVFHYEFVPGIEQEEQDRKDHFFWYWAFRQLMTGYGVRQQQYRRVRYTRWPQCPRRAGCWRSSPRGATRLRLAFEPAEGWSPPEPWRRVIVVDLVHREVVKDDVV